RSDRDDVTRVREPLRDPRGTRASSAPLHLRELPMQARVARVHLRLGLPDVGAGLEGWPLRPLRARARARRARRRPPDCADALPQVSTRRVRDRERLPQATAGSGLPLLLPATAGTALLRAPRRAWQFS